MRKFTIILMLALLFGTVQAVNRFGDTYHEVQVVDETGRNVTDITNLYIYLAGGTTDATIYMDKARQNTITIPMTEETTNTTLVDGRFHWWGPDTYDFSMTNADGVGPMTNSGHADRNSAGGTLVFPSYLTSITTSSWLDAESITMGTGADWVINGGAVANTLTFTPAADNSAVNFGTTGTTLNTDFNIFVGTALGFKLDAGDPSLTWDGGDVLLNHSSNFSVGINTGTSTGATTIGSSTSGTLALETTSGMTLLADDASSIKTSAGTLLVESTGGDLTIDATDKSVKIDGGEAAVDAVTIVSAGGMDISLVDDFDLALVSGATDENLSLVLSGATASSVIITSSGTGTDAIDINTSAGGIDIDIAGGAATEDFSVTTDTSITMTASEEAADAISLDASGTAGGVILASGTGDITLDSGDDIFLAADTGTGDVISIINTQGTAAGAIVMTTTAAGSFDINSGDNITIDVADDITIDTAEGKIHLIADGSTAGDITLDAEDDIILTTTGALTITNTSAATISGALTVTGDTQLISVTRIDTPIETLVTTEAAEITDSGKVFILNHATEFATTLPTVASSSGVTFRFICKLAPDTGSFTVVTDSLEDAIVGSVTVDGAAVPADGPDDTITFATGAAAIGDWIELTSDGTYWYISGQGEASGSIVPSGT